MSDDVNSIRDIINAQHSQGYVYRANGPVIQHFGDIINQGASLDDIVKALQKFGILSRITTQLPETAFRTLLDIVGRVPFKDAGERLYFACRAALPPTAQLVATHIPSLLLADMSEKPWIKAWPPLFECIERFAAGAGMPAVVAGELQRWVDDSAGLVMPPTPATEIVRLRQEIRAEAIKLAEAAASWLQVYLEPDSMNRTQNRKQPLFRVELVLWSPRTDHALVLPTAAEREGGDDTTRLWTLDELPSLLDDVYTRPETLALIPDITRLVFEIVAPSDVLLHGFERWKGVKRGRTYATDHPLVVRLQDRLAIPDPADQKRAGDYWRGKWSAFHNSLRYRHGELLEWQPSDALDVFKLQDDVNLVCLGLSSPLLPGCREVFETLRDAGIPIALWMRGSDLGPGAPADWLRRIAALFQGKPLSDLQETVKQIRRKPEAQKDATHFYNALTLLWDDPDRPPLKYGPEGVFV